MAGQEIDDFLDEEWLSEHIDFPPDVIVAIEQVIHANSARLSYFIQNLYTGFSK